MSTRHTLLSLSDEVIELIVEKLDRHDDIPALRLSCKKLCDLSERYMYRNVVVVLPEALPNPRWSQKLEIVPEQIKLTKYLTILNQNKDTSGSFFGNVVPAVHSYRIQRWSRLESVAVSSRMEFSKSAFLKGSKFNWKVKLGENQLYSFRWRHATTLSYELLCTIMKNQAGSLQELEVSMITPPSADAVTRFSNETAPKIFPKLRLLIYRGLSHTEPIPINQPARGGRFRMVRPIFRKIYDSLEELVLTQEHCISQIGKTPLINGRTFNSFLCDLTDIYSHNQDPIDSASPQNVCLKLKKLELGGFKVEMLFDPVDATIAPAPRVSVSIERLKRLVLLDCDMINSLLRKLTLRKKEIQLTEVGFRIKEQRADDHTQSWDEVSDTMLEFLQSFKGLQVLSIMWEGSHAPKANVVSKILEHHHETIEVYSFVSRDDDPDFSEIYRFVKASTSNSPWTNLIPSAKRPQLREIGINLPQELSTNDYPALRLLSQFKTLKTAHIRNFPPLSLLDSLYGTKGFWRGRGGMVTSEGIAQAARFAEMIALPYYAPPDEAEKAQDDEAKDAELKEIITSFKLKEMAAEHAHNRDEHLFPGFRMPSEIIYSTTPRADVTSLVLDHRAKTDFIFKDIAAKVARDTASIDERAYYDECHLHTRKVLGYSPPTDDEKPRLRLLVIGEWSYRDQMNLTGPRCWDTRAWTTTIGDHRLSVEDDYDSDEADSPEYEELNFTANRNTLLRPQFQTEFDTSLLPIFFKIQWTAEKCDDTGRYRWKAKAIPLKQSTLEGYGWLGDIRSLEFAWQT